MNKHKVIQAICDCRKRHHGRVNVDCILRALGRRANSRERDRMVKMLREDYKGYVEHVSGDGSMRVNKRTLIENAQQERRHERRAQLVWKWILVALIVMGIVLGAVLSFTWGRKLFAWR